MTLKRIMRAVNDIPAINPMLGTDDEPDSPPPGKPAPPPPSGPDRYGSLEIPPPLSPPV